MEVTETQQQDLRLAVVGNVDSGKSTLTGVLTTGQLDDGRGLCRAKVFNYKQEQQSGRTSSISHQLLGFQGEQQVFPQRPKDSRTKKWQYIVQNSSKTITLLDLCGHERYFKTTLFGITSCLPDYCMIVIGANMGITKMSREHIGLAYSLKIPTFFVVTKIDIAPPNILEKTVDTLKNIIKSPAAGRKLPILIQNESIEQLENFPENPITPIFFVNNVTGEGIQVLSRFLSTLPSTQQMYNYGSSQDPIEFWIESQYNIRGIGCVVGGIVKSGTISIDQTLLLGPDGNGQFMPVKVRSIQNKFTNVTAALPQQYVCLNIKPIGKNAVVNKQIIRKGYVLIDRPLQQKLCWEFDAEVVVLHNSTTIKVGYQPVMHCGIVRQTASIVKMSKEVLRSGQKANITFRFRSRPQILHEGMKLVFREGTTRGLGVITYITPLVIQKF